MDSTHGELTHPARECAINSPYRNRVKSKAVYEDAVIHVGDMYRVRGIRISKNLCNPGFDESVHKRI